MAISPAVNVVMSPVADVVLNPGGWVELSNGKTLRTQSFASGFVGNGLRLDQGVSVSGQTSLEVDNVSVRRAHARVRAAHPPDSRHKRPRLRERHRQGHGGHWHRPLRASPPTPNAALPWAT